MSEEYTCDTNHYILWFENADEAIAFAKDTFPESIAYKSILEENEDDEAWICVLGFCDICSHKSIFFAPAEIYDKEISGTECSRCGNMSVYPQEGSFENE